LRAFLLALQLLTVVTVRSDIRGEPAELAASRGFYGLVGALLGAVLALWAWGLWAWLPPLVAAGLLLATWEGLTRFLHADGLADSADALVYFSDRQQTLAIMKDTRLGSFGVAAMITVYLVKFAALACLPWPALAGALVAAPALGRAAAAMLSVLLPAARVDQGLGAAVAQATSPWPGIAAAACAIAAAGLAAGVPGLWSVLAVVALVTGLGAWFRRRLGGVTGDTLGATIELSETVVLVVMAALVC